MLKVWLDLSKKTIWIGLGKHHGLGLNNITIAVT